MNVLVVEPGYLPYEKEINGLEEMQAVVGGWIEAIYPYEEEVAIVCNEEGLINGLPFNRRVPGGYGGVFGTFFICGLGEEDFCSLPAELVERFKSEYQNSELLIGAKGNEPITLPIPSKPKLTGRPSNGKKHQNPER